MPIWVPSVGACVASAVVSAIAAVVDVRTERVPDALTMGALGLAVGLAGQALPSLAWSLLGALTALGACAVAERASLRLGGGDIKLLAALGGLLGPPFVLIAGAVALVCLRLILVDRIVRPAAPSILIGVGVAELLLTIRGLSC